MHIVQQVVNLLAAVSCAVIGLGAYVIVLTAFAPYFSTHNPTTSVLLMFVVLGAASIWGWRFSKTHPVKSRD